ncbi:MAG TPA: 2-amino-4-hydroxy-6-hydroxymethyldihydropteridine diphosphokinase [Anaeromyxobacter sp.]|nr:2-amino-4-hydroxy-6-hydroxymethyldihydropteridine diphosphokinase [Anaeromyxobacter sp.]
MRAFVGVGSNLGDRWAYLRLAARALRAESTVSLLRASRVWDTAPVGPPQPRYLNAALELETRLSAPALHAVLQRIEAEAGRRRGVLRWAARTLDVDLLLYGSEVIRRPGLVVPHPGLVSRRFVLAPLAELGPERVVPSTGQTVVQLLAGAPPADVRVVGLYPG